MCFVFICNDKKEANMMNKCNRGNNKLGVLCNIKNYGSFCNGNNNGIR